MPASFDKYAGLIDLVDSKEEADEKSGEIASLIEIGTYHSGAGAYKYVFDDEDAYIDLYVGYERRIHFRIGTEV